MRPRACNRCERLHLDNPPACRNCGHHLFRSVSKDELLESFADYEVCSECETVHTDHPHQCRNCEHEFFRPLSDSELLERIEEILEAKRHHSSETKSDHRSLGQYLSRILAALRT